MAGFLTRKDELDFVTTEDERMKSKKYYVKNRTRVIERIKNNQEKKKNIEQKLTEPVIQTKPVIKNTEPKEIII